MIALLQDRVSEVLLKKTAGPGTPLFVLMKRKKIGGTEKM